MGLLDPPGLTQAGIDAAPLRTKYDVIVVGGSEVGVMAAVAAGRQGAKVLLASENERIGGFSGWAITVTDMLTQYSPGMIGGLARELFSRIAERETATGVFERWHRTGGAAKPSWYQRAFNEMLAGLPVTVTYNAPLTAVTKTGTKITSATLGGRTYSAPVLIDATFTGDVIQSAALSKSIGRESGTLYGESLAGVLTPQDIGGFDPYVTPGQSSSGLIYGVDSGALGTLGAGDGRVMTFGWRVFLTSVVGEKSSFPTPDMAKYDPARYEIMCRMWASNSTYYNDATNALVRTFQVYPNTLFGGAGTNASPYQYIDLNSLGFLSSNYPNAAENLEYVTATPGRRAQIYDNARQWLLGLFYFILNSNDSRVPANLRTQLALYGPSNKELQAYGGINPALYIREGARVVGDFVLTRPNAIVNNGYLDQIGWGVYNYDGHPVRALVDAGVVKTEGTFADPATGQTAGFPIPYRVLLPKAAECTNLLCPGQPSVSRMVWSAIRAIPVYLHLGEAAGYAAALMVREGGTAQSVDVARVQALQNLQQLKPAAATLSVDGLYSNGAVTQSGTGTAFAAITGTSKRWGWLAAATGGQAYQVAAATDRKLRFAPNLYRNGRYRVFIYYPPAETTDILRASNVPVTISHADGTSTRTLNQRYPGGDGGAWDDLGEFHFIKGTPSANYVELDANGTDGQVVAAALKWVLVP